MIWICPLNQNGEPAGSVSLYFFDGSPMASCAFLPPFFGKKTEWKPANFHFTVSPTWIVVVDGKNWVASAYCGTPGGALEIGGPAVVVFVAAVAVAGSATTARAPNSAAYVRFVTSSPPGSYVGSIRGVKPLIGFRRTYAHRSSGVNRGRERDVARRRNTPPRGRVGSAVRRR